jgi:ParB family chromosome partitioning protein
MRLPRNKSKFEQLDLVDAANTAPIESLVADPVAQRADIRASVHPKAISLDALAAEAQPLLVSVDCLDEDPGNPRTEFPDEDIAELAEDIALRGILQPIVVRRAADDVRYRILFGAKRLRAAKRAGLDVVPIVIGSEGHDAYSEVAENQKRHGLSPLDLARFIKSRSDAGDSNATIAKRLAMNLTTVAHHLALLDLPPELDQVMKTGRCTSPRTLHELRKLQSEEPERVRALVAGEAEITRTTVTAIRAEPRNASATSSLIAQGNAACARLERTLARLNQAELESREGDLAALRRRLADLASRLA